MDAIAPTLERLRHSTGWDAPERNQNVTRVAYRAYSPFEGMHRRGDLTDAQWRAGQKLTRHYMGSMGVNVSNGDGAPDPDGEYSTVYHGQQVSLASKQVTAGEFRGLVHMIEESADLEKIGRDFLAIRNRPQAIMAGKVLVILGLERLALFWRLKERVP